MNKTDSEFYRICLLSGLISNDEFKEEIIKRIETNENDEHIFDLCTSTNRNISIEILNQYKGNANFEQVKDTYYNAVYAIYKSDNSTIKNVLYYLYRFLQEYESEMDQGEMGFIHSIDDTLGFKKPEYYDDIEQIHWMFREFMKTYLEEKNEKKKS